jgi:hypothetical protein
MGIVKGDAHNCLEFDSAYANGTIVKLRNGKWARVVATPSKEFPDLQDTRYTEIDRCPWCNKKVEADAQHHDGRNGDRRRSS